VAKIWEKEVERIGVKMVERIGGRTRVERIGGKTRVERIGAKMVERTKGGAKMVARMVERTKGGAKMAAKRARVTDRHGKLLCEFHTSTMAAAVIHIACYLSKASAINLIP
jgi:hypothetical protein